MKVLWQAICAERLKLRRTLAFAIAVLVPLAMAVLYTLMGTMVPSILATSTTPWQILLRMELAFWGFFALPIFVVLEASLLAELEHKNRKWMHLLALPIPHGTHYIAKCAVMLMMLTFATVLATVFAVLSGWIVQWLTPQLNWTAPPPWIWLLSMMAKSWAGTLLMAMLQLWLALRWRNFIGVVSVGITAVCFGFAVPRGASTMVWYPWSMAGRVMDSPHAALVLSVAAVAALVVVWLGSRDVPRRVCA